jgi:uncharacterized lipoprotein YddW (UPF0748 family)
MKPLGKSFCHAVVIACVAIVATSCTMSRRPPATPTQAERPVPQAPPSKPAPSTELRGVWVSDPTRLDWDRATTELQRAGFNAMYVNFASGGAAFYPRSRVVPDLSTATPADWINGILLAHRRGIAVHAKLITMFMYRAPAGFQKQLIKADRVMRGPDGRPALQNKFTWLCPSQPANRAQLAVEVEEILSRYPVDGLQFDYIRFYEEPTCYCGHCRREFETRLGRRVRRWPDDVMGGALTDLFNEWRRQLINDCVRDLAAQARVIRPRLVLSASVFHDLARGREDRAQDWKLWLDRGYLDYVCTMTYTSDLRDFENRVRGQQRSVANRNQVVVGIGSYKLERMTDLMAEINLTRQLGAPGFVLFSYDDSDARHFLPALR